MQHKPRWTGGVVSLLKMGVGFLALLLMVGFWLLSHTEKTLGADSGADQPIQFDHALHTKNNVKCIVCHPYYENTARAGMPGVNTCRRCHEGVIQVGPEERKIEEAYLSNQEFSWKRLYEVPRDVFFSHRSHVVLGEIECGACHWEIASLPRPLVKPPVVFKMEDCMDDCIECHKLQQEKTNLDDVEECIRCHR